MKQVLSYRLCLIMDLSSKGDIVKGGKKRRQRLTVAFIVTVAGTMEKPVVIWKSENPCCFQVSVASQLLEGLDDGISCN